MIDIATYYKLSLYQKTASRVAVDVLESRVAFYSIHNAIPKDNGPQYVSNIFAAFYVVATTKVLLTTH